MKDLLFANDPRLRLTVKADGVTDDTEAFNEMVEFAQGHGLTVHLEPGMTFNNIDRWLFDFGQPEDKEGET